MVDDPSGLPNPGWYDDPAGSGGQRFWDGSGWTDQTRAQPASGPPSSYRPARRGVLFAGAFVAVLILGAVVGLVVGGPSGSDPSTSSPPAPDDPLTSDEAELPLALQLVGEVDRPTGVSDSVTFVDVGALRAEGIVPDPDPDGDGWTIAEDLREPGTLLVGSPYRGLEATGRTVPMERVAGLAFDEVSASVWSLSAEGWFVPSFDEVTVRDRLEDSPVWSGSGSGTFERVGEFTSDILGGYEPDESERRQLDGLPERIELAGGALRLDAGRMTLRDDPIGEDADWAVVRDRLASEQAVSGWLIPHNEMQEVPDGGEELQPARALAIASVIDGGGLSDLMVLEHGDSTVAEANAEAVRSNLELLTSDSPLEGEVAVDGTTLLIRVRLTGDEAGTSVLRSMAARYPLGDLSLLIGSAGPSTAGEPSEQEPGSSPLDGAELTVGSKDFDEQLILGYISLHLLDDAGAEVTNELDLGSTFAAREALTGGEIDHYWEYTGTAWIEFYEQAEPIPDRVEQYEAVRDLEVRKGLYWLDPSPFNNTYGIALSQEASEEFGTDTISDLGELLESDPDAATLCVESEFESRSDGLPGLEAHYGFEFPTDNVSVLDTGVIYGATADRDPCNFGEVFATDGRIAALDLEVLEDDEAFFPFYNVSPVFTEGIYEQYGQALEEIYEPVTAALDDDTMTELNARVSTEGERPTDVAMDWLTEHGLIR